MVAELVKWFQFHEGPIKTRWLIAYKVRAKVSIP